MPLVFPMSQYRRVCAAAGSFARQMINQPSGHQYLSRGLATPHIRFLILCIFDILSVDLLSLFPLSSASPHKRKAIKVRRAARALTRLSRFFAFREPAEENFNLTNKTRSPASCA